MFRIFRCPNLPTESNGGVRCAGSSNSREHGSHEKGCANARYLDHSQLSHLQHIDFYAHRIYKCAKCVCMSCPFGVSITIFGAFQPLPWRLQQPVIFEQQMAGPSAGHQVFKALAIVVAHLASVEPTAEWCHLLGEVHSDFAVGFCCWICGISVAHGISKPSNCIILGPLSFEVRRQQGDAVQKPQI